MFILVSIDIWIVPKLIPKNPQNLQNLKNILLQIGVFEPSICCVRNQHATTAPGSLGNNEDI